MKRLLSVALAVALVSGVAGVAMARQGGQGQGGSCGDCPQQVQAKQGCEGMGQRMNQRSDCDGPCNDERGSRMKARHGRADKERGNRNGCGDGSGQGRDCRSQDATKAKITLDEAKAQAKIFVDSSLKGATLKGVEESPRGRRFPHYRGTVEQGGKLYGIMIDANDGGVRGMRRLPAVSPAK